MYIIYMYMYMYKCTYIVYVIIYNMYILSYNTILQYYTTNFLTIGQNAENARTLSTRIYANLRESTRIYAKLHPEPLPILGLCFIHSGINLRGAF